MEKKSLNRDNARSLHAKKGHLIIPNGITEVERNAFKGRHQMESVSLPNTLVAVGDKAFAYTHLRKIVLPSTLTWMGFSPFGFCRQMQEIEVEAGNLSYKAVNGVLYTYDLTCLVQYPAGRKAEVFVVPETVKSIGAGAFAGCIYLKKVILPAGFKTLSRKSFSSCDSLKEIVLPKSLERIEGQAFEFCHALKKISMPSNCFAETDAFWGCNASVTLVSAIKESGKVAFKIELCEKENDFEPNQIILPKRCEETDLFLVEQEHVFFVSWEGRKLKKQIEKNDAALDENGIVKVGTHVVFGDVLVEGIPNRHETLEERLLFAIFGQKYIQLTVPLGIEGEVTRIEADHQPYSNERDTQADLISITVLQRYCIGLGDILSDDEGNEGIVVGFDERLPYDTVKANFCLGNILKRRSIAEKNAKARSVGPYNFREEPISAGYKIGCIRYEIAKVPQKLSSDRVKWFFEHGYGDLLQNILLFQADESENRDKAIVSGEGTNLYYLPKKRISSFIKILHALYIDPVFRDESGNVLEFSCLKTNTDFIKALRGNITLELEHLSEGKVRLPDSGEVESLLLTRGGKVASLLDELGRSVTSGLDARAIDFSASCGVTIDNSVGDFSCGLPLQLAIELFKPILCEFLQKEGWAESEDAAKAYLMGIGTEQGEEKARKIETLNHFLQKYKLIVFAKRSVGEIAFLTPVISESRVLAITSKRFFELSLAMREHVTIVFPITNTAQRMIVDIEAHGIPVVVENDEKKAAIMDVAEEIRKAMAEGREMLEFLKEALARKRMWTFETPLARLLVGKPSNWAWKFYDIPEEASWFEETPEEAWEKDGEENPEYDDAFFDDFEDGLE